MARGRSHVGGWTEVGLVAVLVFGALLWPLHSPAIGLHGEAREGLVVRTIVRTGNWILPERNGRLPTKPPLFHWIAAGAVRVFGWSDAAVRSPSALAAVAVAATTFALGVAIGGRLLGRLATAALLGMLTFWEAASAARVDMTFAAATTVVLAAFYLWYRDRRTGAPAARWARPVAYLALASAVLAKGPIGLVLPGVVIAAFLAWERAPHVIREFWSWPLVALVLAIDVGWYALAYRAGGSDFVATQLVRENVDRFLGHGDFPGGTSRFRMEGTLVTSLFPWNLALLLAAVRGARGERTDEAGRFLHAWWLAILVFFSVSSGKRPVYLLPLMPAVALLAGRGLQDAYAKGQGVLSWRRVRMSLGQLAIGLALFDGAAWGGSMALRHYQSNLRSLAPFSDRVDGILPADAPLYAALALPEPQLLVLAYTLDRRLTRKRLECTGSGAYFLLLQEPPGALAASGLSRAPVSLARDDGRRCPLSTARASGVTPP